LIGSVSSRPYRFRGMLADQTKAHALTDVDEPRCDVRDGATPACGSHVALSCLQISDPSDRSSPNGSVDGRSRALRNKLFHHAERLKGVNVSTMSPSIRWRRIRQMRTVSLCDWGCADTLVEGDRPHGLH